MCYGEQVLKDQGSSGFSQEQNRLPAGEAGSGEQGCYTKVVMLLWQGKISGLKAASVLVFKSVQENSAAIFTDHNFLA